MYATCAALIKANHLTAEALAVAKDERVEHDVPEPLVRAWRAGQKMRNFFKLADVSQTALSDRPSLYAGADDHVIDAASESVVELAKLMLRCEPDVPPAPLLTRQGSGKFNAKKNWGMLAR